MKKATEWDMSLEELEQLRKECDIEKYKLANAIQDARKNEQPHRMRLIRRKIARILTVMHRKKKSEALK